ncbi:MAG: hypothetical protein Q9P01_21880 [Anaerolineae bacterium]|nr:hypothetical protein [Anaerolineae bacterium]MDQ7037391.1 hypothetical protein [Anaerolineae bacterium]
MSEKIKNKSLTRQEELMEALNITEDDITANREGRITPEQKLNLQKRVRRRIIFIVLGAIFLLVLGIYTVNVFLREGVTGNSIPPALTFTVGLLIELIVVMIVGRFGNDVKDGHVEAMQGLAVVKSGETYSLSVNNIRFNAPQKAIIRIKHLEPHIIYYLPRSKVVLSVEVMES